MSLADSLLEVALNYGLHSTLALAGVWLLLHGRRVAAWHEWLWRCALILPLLTALISILPMVTPGSPERSPAPSTALAGESSRAQPASEGISRVNPGAAGNTSTTRVADPAWTASLIFSPSAWARSAALWLWLIGAALGLYGLLIAQFRLSRQRESWRRFEDLRWKGDAARIAQSMHTTMPALYTGAGRSPLALMDHSVFVPEWAHELSLERRQALLAHEIAHLKRGDPRWRLLTHAFERVFWFQPLNRLARQRLEGCAEFICDAHAVESQADPRALAACLAVCATQGIDRQLLAAAIASEPSLLRRRIQQLNEETSMPSTTSPLLRAAIVLSCAGLLYAMPSVQLQAQMAETPAPSGARSKPSNVSLSHRSDDGEVSMNYRSRSADGTLDVEAEGKMGFSEAEDAIIRLDDDGKFDIEDDRDGSERRIVYTARNAQIVSRYFFDGDEMPIDAAGKAWLARVIPDILRESAIDVENRVERIVKRGGTSALFAEIEQIQSDFARRAYLVTLFERGALDSAEIDRSLQLIGGLTSDFERRTSLSALIERQTLSSQHREKIVALVEEIGSDFEARQVLASLVPTLDDNSAPILLRALQTIGSDFERRQVLELLFARPDLSPALIQVGLAALKDLGSDFELRMVLESAAPHVAHNQDNLLRFVAATREIGSDFERRQALSSLLKRIDGKPVVMAAILDSVAEIGSDFEARTLLTEIAPLLGSDEKLRARYRDISANLGDFERAQALAALSMVY